MLPKNQDNTDLVHTHTCSFGPELKFLRLVEAVVIPARYAGDVTHLRPEILYFMLAGVVGVLVVNGLNGDHFPTLGVATSVGHAVAALPVTRLTKV